MPTVQVSVDGITIQWPGSVIVTLTSDGIGYAINQGDYWIPGKHEIEDEKSFEAAMCEIKEAVHGM